jgi:glycosyltransferase involved in cell wall biosynthesis
MIAVSKAELENVRRLTNDCTVINNFIDISSMPEKPKNSRTSVGITGRITEAKNPPLFNRIASAMPNVEFLWIGDGPLRDQLSADNITVTGQVTRSEALQKLSQLSIYLQTSSWEGMPISLLEAMACELPVIVSDIPAHKNLVTDSVNGLICKSDDERDFMEKIKELLSNRELQHTLAMAAKSHVLTYHDVNTAIKQYAKEYRGLTYSTDPQTTHPEQ